LLIIGSTSSSHFDKRFEVCDAKRKRLLQSRSIIAKIVNFNLIFIAKL